MMIDLKWAIPIVLPFFLLLPLRLLWFVSGAEWSNPHAAAAGCAIVGFLIGLVAAVEFEGNWKVRIGRGGLE